MRLLTAALLATLVLPGAGALAQDPEAGAPDPQGVEPAAGEPATETEPAPAERDGDNPFDYEASEEISEDLSVSFPVDI
jgi:hypothetical protein